MGKPNFNFQKRQKELAKQKKNEEKRQRKLNKKASASGEEHGPPVEGETVAGETGAAAPAPQTEGATE